MGCSPREGVYRPPNELIALSIGFWLVFSAYVPVQTYLVSSFDAGNGALAAIYSALALTTLVAPRIVERLSARRALFVASCGYAAFALSTLTRSSAAVLCAAAVLGVSGAVLWTAQGEVLASLSTDATRGRNSGFFLATFRLSLLGLLTAGLLLDGGGEVWAMFAVMSAVAAVGCVVLLLVWLAHRKRTAKYSVSSGTDGAAADVAAPAGSESAKDPASLASFIAESDMSRLTWIAGLQGIHEGVMYSAVAAIIPQAHVGLVFTVAGVTNVAGNVAGGSAWDALGRVGTEGARVAQLALLLLPVCLSAASMCAVLVVLGDAPTQDADGVALTTASDAWYMAGASLGLCVGFYEAIVFASFDGLFKSRGQRAIAMAFSSRVLALSVGFIVVSLAGQVQAVTVRSRLWSAVVLFVASSVAIAHWLRRRAVSDAAKLVSAAPAPALNAAELHPVAA